MLETLFLNNIINIQKNITLHNILIEYYED